MSINDFVIDSAAVFVLLAVCTVGPGLFFVRRLRWTPVETLCASVAASLIFVALGSMAIFWLNLSAIGAMHWALSAVCLVLSALAWPDARRLWRRAQVRRTLSVLLIVWLWTALLLLLIRHYGGGRWWGDWFEQYQRSMFFIGHSPLDFRFLGQYLVTDRPPLMNLVCAHYLAEVDARFVTYQWTAAFLNVLPALPCCLFASSVMPRGRRRQRAVLPVLIVLLIASPMFVQNVTFVWSKSFAAFFALLGLWFYVRGWMKGDSTRLIAGFVLATAGCLVHFYVAPWLVVMVGHYVLAVWPRRARRGRELAVIALLCAALLIFIWYGWAIQHFGIKAAFRSHLTEPYPGLHNTDFLTRVRWNSLWSVVPYLFRPPLSRLANVFGSASNLRDAIFSFYQTNAVFALGSVGAAALLWVIFWRSAPWRHWPRRLRRFWLGFLVITTALGLCIVPMPEPWGAAHLFLLPTILLGVAVLAGSAASMPRGLQTLLLIGVTIDFSAGVLFQVHMENGVFDLLAVPGSSTPLMVLSGSQTDSAVGNYMLKQSSGLFFVGDALTGLAVPIELALCVIFALLLMRMSRAIRRRPARGQSMPPPMPSG